MSVLVVGFFHVSSSCFPRVLLSIDPRGRLSGLGGMATSALEEFEDNEGGILG